MKTKEQIKHYATLVAWEHFYSDEDTPWEPFENYPQGWIEEQRGNLADAIEKAMIWATK